MEKNGWKIAAIVSTILLILVLTYFSCVFYGNVVHEYKEQTCAYDICGLDVQEHDSYFYTPVDDSCFCFNAGELDFIEFVDEYLGERN